MCKKRTKSIKKSNIASLIIGPQDTIFIDGLTSLEPQAFVFIKTPQRGFRIVKIRGISKIPIKHSMATYSKDLYIPGFFEFGE